MDNEETRSNYRRWSIIGILLIVVSILAFTLDYPIVVLAMAILGGVVSILLVSLSMRTLSKLPEVDPNGEVMRIRYSTDKTAGIMFETVEDEER